MTILDIIDKKKKKMTLTQEEINFWIDGMMSGEIKDYQISALLMAIVINGMNDDEVYYLTDAMLNSGEKIDLSSIEGIKVDKHSTGGVGDKVTPILAPLLATFGIKVAKMSGRGLGHTGGTVDKFESIPGYKIELTRDEFIKQVNDIGVAVISQSGNLVPADKKLYALRDVTSTEDSIPLIASSIMSKKIASGADYIFIDVKVGNGALVKTLEEARELATTMVKIGKRYGKKTMCILTDMNEPLGFAIGNALEVREVIDTLKGMGPSDVLEIIIEMAGLIVSSALNIDLEEAKIQCFKKINNGEAYAKFEELVNRQQGDLSKLEVANRIVSFRTPKTGYINHIDALKLGEIARQIGAGRYAKEDTIDYGVGIVLTKKVGDYVESNEELARFYLTNKDVKLNDIWSCYNIGEEKIEKLPLIYEIIN